jgi:uncharacterized protein (DUF2132 family)
MQERREQLLEELRKAEQARDLLRELEQNLSKNLSKGRSRELAPHVRRLEQLAQSLPEAHIVRLVIESALGPSEVGNVSRARSAIEGEISTLQGALRYKAT